MNTNLTALNPPASIEEVFTAYEKFPAEFQKRYPLTRRGISNERAGSMGSLRILLANVGREIKDGSQILIDAFKQVGVDVRDPQVRHLRMRSSGNGFPIHAKFSKADGLMTSHYMLVAFEPDPRWKAPAEDDELLTEDEWEDLQEKTKWVCACCHNPESMNQCHKGHLNPNKPLTRDNCAPMCRKCNHETSQTDTLYKWDDTGNWPHVRVSHRKTR